MILHCLWAAVSGLLFALSLAAQPYSIQKTADDGVPVVVLRDARTQTSVSVVPSVGNNAFRFEVGGENVFWFPFESPAEFARRPRLSGNPFLAPWANRIDGHTFFANGKPYQLDDGVGNLWLDGNGLPLHGLLAYFPAWEVVEMDASGSRARVTSRLDFARHAGLMAQFPFAHVIEMSYILRDGALEVATAIRNTGTQPMPLVIGYHPYFQIHDAPRDEWTVRIAARSLWTLNEKLTPTGERRPVEEAFSNPEAFRLQGKAIDHVFGDLVRDADGRARFALTGKRQKIEVEFGPRYSTAVIYAPRRQGREFLCFEPMTGVTNGFNLAHRGLYGELQTIAPGEQWRESYWIRPSGFE